MTAGLQVWGTHGFLQIDELYKNLALRGTATISGASTLVLAGATVPVLAMRTVGSTCMPAYLSFGGGSATFGFRTPTPAGTKYWWFDQPGPPPVNYGMQIFLPGGAVAFDASFDYMRVVGQAVIGSAPNATFRQPAGKTYAWVEFDIGQWTQDMGGGQTSLGAYEVGMDANGDLYRLLSAQLESRSGPATGGSLVHVRSPSVIVIDVTGL